MRFEGARRLRGRRAASRRAPRPPASSLRRRRASASGWHGRSGRHRRSARKPASIRRGRSSTRDCRRRRLGRAPAARACAGACGGRRAQDVAGVAGHRRVRFGRPRRCRSWRRRSRRVRVLVRAGDGRCRQRRVEPGSDRRRLVGFFGVLADELGRRRRRHDLQQGLPSRGA